MSLIVFLIEKKKKKKIILIIKDLLLIPHPITLNLDLKLILILGKLKF